MASPYRILGVALIVAGAELATISYFVINSVFLTAVGLSAVLLGLTSTFLANARPPFSAEAYQMLLKTGEENTATSLAELGIKNKAIYLPGNTQDGHFQALIPLTTENDIKKIKQQLSGNWIVKSELESEGIAIAVNTPGAQSLCLLQSKPGPHEDEITAAMVYILVDLLGIATGVKVNLTDLKVKVEVRGAKLNYKEIPYYQCVGSPFASVAAAITSEALGKHIRVMEEIRNKGKNEIVLEVLS